MAGTLFVVATPIGHLEDISARALRVLGSVDLVAAEDTRRTGNLLRHFGLTTRLTSLHAHNEHHKAAEIVEVLRGGQSVALASDAGTPGISDPGATLVRLAREAGVRVEGIPGPSAVALAMSVAGLADTTFAFAGFPPNRGKDRKQWFAKVDTYRQLGPVVCFEAPHRLHATLRQLFDSVKQPIILFRELTKVHEEVAIGDPDTLIARFAEPVGEFTLVIPAARAATEDKPEIDVEAMRTEIGQMTTSGTAGSRRDAARQIAERLGLSTRQVYDLTRD
ncbi:MAG: 16S rRNA (cytidine(1402)-2'-O)-methyltransferase [Acidobacteria bacterium]|nr:16S rRNA (cytidine(1402)-2'-O)-methyltransferase [Acidobacteriota bacterium]